MTSPFPLRVCKECRKDGKRDKVETINGLCFRPGSAYHYQNRNNEKNKEQLEKEQVRKKKYAERNLKAFEASNQALRRKSLYLELQSGEQGTLDGKLIEKPKKARKKKEDKSVPELIKEAEAVFNRRIRERDTVNGYGRCISCDELFSFEELQAGHYLPAGSNAAVRFDDINVNGQCAECNCNKHGNQESYRKGLIKKYGRQEVEALELRAKQPFKWDRSYLIAIIKEESRLNKAS